MDQAHDGYGSINRADLEEIQRRSAEFDRIPMVRQTLEMNPEPVIVLNEQRQIVFANSAFRRIAQEARAAALEGCRFGEAVGCAYSGLAPEGCGGSEFCSKCGGFKAVRSAVAGHADSQECRIALAGGDALDLQVSAQPFVHGEEKFTFVFVSDRSGEKRRRVLERLFFHDVLNTAGGLYGFANLLEEALPEEDQCHYFAHMVYQLSTSVIDEIEAQRQLAAAEADELMCQVTSVGLLDVVRDVADAYGRHEVAKRRKVAVSADSRDVVVQADLTLLKRVVGNMTKNALEASRDGDTVTLSCWETADEGGLVQVHNVTCMSRDTQLQVFQRSFSTKGPGRGLGTYSIKLLGERYLKGRVSFNSTQEDGTTFTLWLPAS